MDKLKIAHIGTGNRGTSVYLPLIAKLKDALNWSPFAIYTKIPSKSRAKSITLQHTQTPLRCWKKRSQISAPS